MVLPVGWILSSLDEWSMLKLSLYSLTVYTWKNLYLVGSMDVTSPILAVSE